MPLNPFSALPGRAVLASDELDRLFAELELSRQTIALRDAALQAAELKIQALTLELAHHKRIRFGQKSEALSAAGQGDLFNETVIADQSAIEEELERLARQAKPSAPISFKLMRLTSAS